jgi:hypothetical protein
MGDIITERNGNARAFWRGIGANEIQARRGRVITRSGYDGF